MNNLTLSGLFVKVAPSTRGHRSAKARPKRAFSTRLGIEGLEDRLAPAVFTVNTLADTVDANPAVTSLRKAITAANSMAGDDIINFSVTGTINLTGALPDLSSNIQIQGPGAAGLTVRRDTGGDYRIFTVTGGPTVVLDGLTISNGHVGASYFNAFGGGVYNAPGGSLTVTNCTLSGNSAGYGGGIDNCSGTLTVSNSTLSGNSSLIGGAIDNQGGTLTVSNSILSGNSSEQGGGIANSLQLSTKITGTLTVSNSTLSANSAHNGGGIDNDGTMTVSGCTLSGNSGYNGGGIDNELSGGLTVSNSTLSGNVAGYGGGGVYNSPLATLTVSNSTLSGNSASYGGGIQNYGDVTFGFSRMTVSNSTLSGNSAAYGGGIWNNSYPVTVSNSTLSANSASNGGGGGIYGYLTLNNSIVANSPAGGDFLGYNTGGSHDLFGMVQLGPLQNNGGPTQTQSLPDGSPAIDAGDSGLVLAGVTTDQRGPSFPRVYNGTVDIGAFEDQSLRLATAAALTSAVNPSTYGQTVRLTTTVSAAASTPSGTVEFLDGGTALGSASLVDGNALFDLGGLTVGNHQFTAIFDGNGKYSGSSASLTQSVNKADQTIDFALGDGSYDGDPFVLSATALFHGNYGLTGSGLPVSFAVVSGPATVSGNQLTITGAGTVVIKASAAGNGNFNATVVNHSFTVTQLTSNGRLDPSFGNGGKQTIDFTEDFQFQYALDATFPNINPSDDRATGVAVQADGSIVVIGTSGNQDSPFIGRTLLTSRGQVYTKSFDVPGFVTPTSAVQADGKTIVVGTYFQAGTGNDFLVRRYNTNGSLDTSFGNGSAVTVDFGSNYDVATCVAVQPDGKIVVVGYSNQGDNRGNDFAVARLDGSTLVIGDAYGNSMSQTQVSAQLQQLEPTIAQPGQSAQIGFQAADNNQLNEVLNAANRYDATNNPSGLQAAPVGQMTITVDLASGTYGGQTVNLWPGEKLVIHGASGTTTFVGHSPALTVVSGVVSVDSIIFTNATNAPTILVQGGSLTLRNSTVEESTGYAQAAIQVDGGVVDLGSAASPGGNTIKVNGPGEFVHTSTPAAVSAVGDTFAVNGTVLAASAISFTTASGPSYAVLLGLPTTFPATVKGPAGSVTPTGTIDVFDTTTGLDLGSIALASGTVSVNTAALPVGTQSLTLSYSGDGHFVPSRTTLTLTVIPTASLSGIVFSDFNNDGQVDFGEKGIAGVPITLTGTDDLGHAVNLSQTTNSAGAYVFLNLRPGSYTITETQQPAGYTPGIVSVGTGGGTVSGTQFTVSLAVGVNAMNYNYGERPVATGPIQYGQTAGIGFWNNKNGQALIKALNGGGTSTQLGDWLAATFPHMFGASAGSNNLASKNNDYVASFFQGRFIIHGQKLDAQVLATALAVYVTDATLDNTGVGTQYGFIVSGNGVATATFNVGDNGAAFGVANNTKVTVMDLLLAVDSRSVNGNGSLYNGDIAKRKMANDVFSAINEIGKDD